MRHSGADPVQIFRRGALHKGGAHLKIGGAAFFFKSPYSFNQRMSYLQITTLSLSPIRPLMMKLIQEYIKKIYYIIIQ